MTENKPSFYEQIRTIQQLLKISERKIFLIQKEFKSTINLLNEQSDRLTKTLIQFSYLSTGQLFSRESIRNQQYTIRSSNNAMIPHFFQIMFIMKFLYKHPMLCYHILKYSSQDFFKLQSLCSLFSVQMYNNPLKPNIPIDEEFFIILTLALKEEISTYIATSKNEFIFKNQDISWNLLDSLTNRSEVKTFFVNSLHNFIHQLDYNQNMKEFIFDFDELKKKISSMKLEPQNNEENYSQETENLKAIERDLRQPLDRALKKKIEETIQPGGLFKRFTLNDVKLEAKINRNFSVKKEKIKVPSLKYFLPLKKKDIINRLNETNDKSLKDYLSNHLSALENDPEFFNTNNFINKLFQFDKPSLFLEEYEKYFLIVIFFLEQFLEVIFNILKFVPSSIKYVLTIISKLLNKKYNNVQSFERTGIFMRFYFCKIIEPFINHLEYNGLTTAVSINTLKVLKILTTIITQFFSGKMFSSTEKHLLFMPFNIFFIENVNKYTNVFDEVINEKLSNQVNLIIENDDITNDNLQYDIFKEYPNILITQNNIYFTINQFIEIFQILNKNTNLFNEEKNKILIKAINQIHLESLIQLSQQDKEQLLCINNDGNYLNSNYPLLKLLGSQNIQNTSAFEYYITNKATRDNDVSNVMNYLKQILLVSLPFEIPEEKFFVFDIQNIDDFIGALNALKEINYEQMINKGDTLLYLNLFIKKIKEIDNAYKENNYELFFKEFINDINELIKIFDYEIILKLKLVSDKLDQSIQQNNRFDSIMEQITINKSVINFINSEKILVRLTLSINLKKNITKLKIKEIKVLQEDKIQRKGLRKQIKYKRYCANISDFIKNFKELYEIHKEKVQKQSILKLLSFYFNQFIYPKIIDKESMKVIVRDYIMNKLFDPLFPSIPSEKDEKINKSFQKDQTDIKKMTEMKMNFEDLFEKTKIIFGEMNKAKNPNEKYISLKKIIDIQQLISFKSKSTCKDDELIILNYLIINSQPQMLDSNVMFIKLYQDFIDAKSNEINKILINYEGIISLSDK